MTTLISILASTKTGAFIEIIVLLAVAGIIAFLTAYLYYKPIYLKKISGLENEKAELEKNVNSLRSTVAVLKTQVEELEQEIKKEKEKEKKKVSKK